MNLEESPDFAKKKSIYRSEVKDNERSIGQDFEIKIELDKPNTANFKRSISQDEDVLDENDPFAPKKSQGSHSSQENQDSGKR